MDFPVPGLPLIQRKPLWPGCCNASRQAVYFDTVKNQRHVLPWAAFKVVKRSSILEKSRSTKNFLRVASMLSLTKHSSLQF